MSRHTNANTTPTCCQPVDVEVDQPVDVYNNPILYQYTDTVFAIKRFNDAKDGDAFPIPAKIKINAMRAGHTFVTYLFATR